MRDLRILLPIDLSSTDFHTSNTRVMSYIIVAPLGNRSECSLQLISTSLQQSTSTVDEYVVSVQQAFYSRSSRTSEKSAIKMLNKMPFGIHFLMKIKIALVVKKDCLRGFQKLDFLRIEAIRFWRVYYSMHKAPLNIFPAYISKFEYCIGLKAKFPSRNFTHFKLCTKSRARDSV